MMSFRYPSEPFNRPSENWQPKTVKSPQSPRNSPLIEVSSWVAVNAASNFPKCAEVKFLSWRVSVISRPGGDQGLHFFGGRPRRRGECAGIGALMVALDRTCSGMRSACWRRR